MDVYCNIRYITRMCQVLLLFYGYQFDEKYGILKFNIFNAVAAENFDDSEKSGFINWQVNLLIKL